jgi:CheY-like chemotaxis protein
MTRAATARSILTVEDDPIVRADLRLVLEDAGFEVCEAARDGVEAVELERKHRPDLVLMDLGLPRRDGVEAIRQIRDSGDVPIVALTGHSRNDVVDRAIDAGADAFVLKPFHAEQLVGTVARTLADHAAKANAAAEHERRHYLLLVESMLREGRSEREIIAALPKQSRRDGATTPSTSGSSRRRWLRR